MRQEKANQGSCPFLQKGGTFKISPNSLWEPTFSFLPSQRTNFFISSVNSKQGKRLHNNLISGLILHQHLKRHQSYWFWTNGHSNYVFKGLHTHDSRLSVHSLFIWQHKDLPLSNFSHVLLGLLTLCTSLMALAGKVITSFITWLVSVGPGRFSSGVISLGFPASGLSELWACILIHPLDQVNSLSRSYRVQGLGLKILKSTGLG